MTWTVERIDALKDLWSKGYSASQIANRIGIASRSAVIGKVHRLGLSGRKVSTRIATRKRDKVRQSAAAGNSKRIIASPFTFKRETERPAPATVNRDPLPGAKLIGLLDLEPHHCRYMHGDKFCGCTSIPGTSWCKDHFNVVFRSITVATSAVERELEPA